MDDPHTYVKNLCSKLVEGSLSSSEWMKYYDEVFRLTSSGDNNMEYYSAVEAELTSYSKTLKLEQYAVLTGNLHRIFGYLHRFWIPSKNLDDFYKLSEKILKASQAK